MPRSAEKATRPWGERGPAVRFAGDVDPRSREQVAELLAGWQCGLFPGAEVAVSVLVGGANNRNFVVEADGVKYALRVANEQNERFAVDRESAIEAQRAAATGGLAPAVVAAKLPEGHILSEFLEGETLLGAERLHEPEILRLAGRTLRRLHSLPASIRSYSPFQDIRLWTRLAREDGTELPGDLDELLGAAWGIEAIVEKAGLPAVFCHNDTVPQNFILRGDDLRLVDWDYAGKGWACFELASFAATAELDPDQQEVLLRSYDAQTGGGQSATVDLLRYVAALREASWALMAAPILEGTTTPEGDDFYENYLRDYLRTARELFRSRRFDDRQRAASEAVGRGRTW